MRRIFWLVLFFLIIVAVCVFMPFRVYGADVANFKAADFQNIAKQQLTKEQFRPPKVGKNRRWRRPPQPSLPDLPSRPKSEPNFFRFRFFQPLHPIRHA